MALYYLANAVNARQAGRLARLENLGSCLLCNPERPLYATTHWSVVSQEESYPGANVHVLIASREHVTALTDLGAPALADLHRVLAWARQMFQPAGWGLVARNGDPARSGASIAHLHLHLIVPDEEALGGVQVTFGGGVRPAKMKAPPLPIRKAKDPGQDLYLL